jgi:hypothetical protein
MDTAVVPILRRQRRPPSTPCACLQPRQFHANIGNAEGGEPRSPTSLHEKLIKIGAKVVSHGRYVTFRIAEVAVSRRVSGNPVADRRAAGAAGTSMNGSRKARTKKGEVC